MNHNERVQSYERYMAAQGIPRSSASPMLWQWLWSRGIECPPPPFMRWIAVALITGAGLSAIPVVLWLFAFARHPFRHPMPAHVLMWFMGISFAVGAVLGPIYYRRMARRCGLVDWSSFRGARQWP
jgi:hypothetical protein